MTEWLWRGAALITFLAVMWVLGHYLRIGIENWGVLFWVPFMIAVFAIGYWIDRRDRQRLDRDG